VKIERVPATWDTYTLPYRIEYINAAANRVNEIRPSVLIVFCTYCIPILFKLRYRPKFVLYHSYEVVTKYGRLDLRMNRHASHMIDLITFPEENRARIDTTACGYDGVDKAILYNCADLIVDEPVSPAPARARNGRIIYYGTFSTTSANSQYFLDPRMQGIPVDIYGRIMEATEEKSKKVLSQLQGTIRYRGLLDAGDLVRARREYAYSIVMWNPTVSDNHLYAAPNRLFTSIQAGVPPIVAPHPQCRMLVERYQCGLVMHDWTFEAFHEALRKGLKLYGTSRYADMVENCRLASEDELNWDHQFDKIKRFLPAEI